MRKLKRCFKYSKFIDFPRIVCNYFIFFCEKVILSYKKMSKLTKSASNWRMHSIVYCPKEQKDKKETVDSRSQISTEDQREKKFLTVI